MAFLGQGKKADLVKLVDELEIPRNGNETMMQLKVLVTGQEDYDPEFVAKLYQCMLKENQEEILRKEKLQQEAELKARELELNFELEKLKIEQGISSSQSSSENRNSRHTDLNLKKLIPEFNPDKSDISLYLVLFERQVKRAKIPKENWVSHLVGLLPIDIISVIAREPEESAENYDHIKQTLLNRYKLNPESFRQKFVSHQKNPMSTWKDFAFELRNYLREWLDGLEVDNFEALKDLLVADQMKKRAKMEVREHFIDKWADIKTESEIVELLDGYDSVRAMGPKFKDARDSRVERTRSFTHEKPRENKPKFYPPGASAAHGPVNRTRMFERRVNLKCFGCGSETHLRSSCPRLQKKNPSSSVNNVQEIEKHDLLESYTFPGKVNNQRIEILRDSGATLDIVCRKFICPEEYTGETVWIKQPLSLELICLPLARVEIEGDFGNIITKAAVCGNHLDQNRYLLGNKTAEMIKERYGYDFFSVEQLNAVQTRSHTRRLQREAKTIERDTESTVELRVDNREEPENSIPIETEEPIVIPTLEAEAPELDLLKVDKKGFLEAQQKCEEVKELVSRVSEQSAEKADKTYSIIDGILVRNREDRLGNVTKLLVIPKALRHQVKTLCHEGTSAHLGGTKSKDKLIRYFYWPNCYKDMDEFVRSCDQCQRAGRPNEKKKAPLKLVPVIQEVFSRINIDTCGPLPLTTEGHRYILTAICMTSKYPEAIPLADISSVKITEALLNIFSRTGFPREVQSDLGTSFTSALTTEFFDKFNIKVHHSSVNHPQSNPIERFHRTVKRLLRAVCLESGADWDKHLPAILLALRTVVHESTGYTPSELVYGKNLRTPETLLMERWLDPPPEGDLVTEYVFNLINRLKRCRELAITRIEEMQGKRKVWYDKNAVKREFKEGDLVLVLATTRPHKLSVQWVGPGKIRTKISETNYVVEIPGKKERTQIYHINMLKPYHTRPEHVNLLSYERDLKLTEDHDLDIPYLENNPTNFDFRELVRHSELEKKLTAGQIDQLKEVLDRFASCFSNDPGTTNLVEHDITLISDKPIRSKPYRTSQRQTEILKSEIQKMLRLGIIEVGESDYTSPLILVEAPGKDPRPCVDYRRLNEIIRTEYFPLPNIEERVEKVSSAKYITVLDLAKGYWQIPLSEKAQRYAAFCTTFGTFRCLKMSFGLKNAPFFFSKLMSDVLKEMEDFAVPYLDDVAIFSDTWEAHLKHISLVLERIKRANLKIKPAKCKFAQSNVKYLGHIVGNGARTPAEAKIGSVKGFPTPRTKTQIRAFLGLAGYYSRYINNYSVLAAPLTDALKGRAKKSEIIWTDACEKAFRALKKSLTDKPVLHAPNFNREFIVQTDASNSGIGVVLSQESETGEEHPILYLSKKFSDVERRYSTTERECASIVFAIKKLHYYLDGRKFTIITDHNPLRWLRTNASSNPRLMRWALALQPYEFEVKHKPGRYHKNADSLSRVGPDPKELCQQQTPLLMGKENSNTNNPLPSVEGILTTDVSLEEIRRQ